MDILQIIENVKEGKQEALNVLKDVKEFKKYFDGLVKEVEEIALEEASSYESNFELNGLKFEKRNGRATYNYKKIDIWVAKKNELKEIEDNLKANFSAFKRGVTMVSEDGEVLPVPEVSYSKDVLIVKEK